jgi:hypothetical protein
MLLQVASPSVASSAAQLLYVVDAGGGAGQGVLHVHISSRIASFPAGETNPPPFVTSVNPALVSTVTALPARAPL